MTRRATLAAVFMLLLTGLLASTFSIESARADGVIYIRADGSMDPPTTPIQRDGNMYAFTGNVSGQIVVEKSNVVIDGSAFTLQRSGAYDGSKGISLVGRSHVVIRNMGISGFYCGAWLSSCSSSTIGNNSIVDGHEGVYLGFSSNNYVNGNRIESVGYGIYVDQSSGHNSVSENSVRSAGYGVYVEWFSDYNIISGNSIVAGGNFGVYVGYSRYNNVSRNNVTASGQYTIFLDSSDHCRVDGNNVTAGSGQAVYLDYYADYNAVEGNNIDAANGHGIFLDSHSEYNAITRNNVTADNGYGVYLYLNSIYNTVTANNIADCAHGIRLYESSYNIIYHNNLADNTVQASTYASTGNIWDNGYPLGGNYWSEYSEADDNHDGIGETAYVIGPDNVDRFPLMNPYPSIHALAADSVNPDKTLVGEGASARVVIHVIVANLGHFPEVCNVTIYANATPLMTYPDVFVAAGDSTAVDCLWNVTGTGRNVYVLSSTVTSVQSEYNTADNTCVASVIVQVVMPGDGDADGNVDIYDVVAVAACYGSSDGLAGFNPNADWNCNGKIDIFDVIAVTCRYGQEG